MGAPTSVQQAAFGGGETPLALNFNYNAPTAGTGNIILPGPAAGFIRIVGDPPSGGGLFGINRTGGSVDLTVRRAGNRVKVQTSLADGNGFFGPSALFLQNGEDLTLDFDSGSGGTGVTCYVPYRDIPVGDLVPFEVTLGTIPTEIIPAAPDSSKVHVLPWQGEEPLIDFWNDNGVSARTVDLYIRGSVFSNTAFNSISALSNTGWSEFSAGLVVDSVGPFAAAADAAGDVVVRGLYEVRDAA